MYNTIIYEWYKLEHNLKVYLKSIFTKDSVIEGSSDRVYVYVQVFIFWLVGFQFALSCYKWGKKHHDWQTKPYSWLSGRAYGQEHKTEALPPGRYKQLDELSVIQLLYEQSFKGCEFVSPS